MNLEIFYKKEWIRVSNNYSKKKHSGFKNKSEFANWFVSELKKYNCRCYYCETSIFDINLLIDAGKLKTRAVKGEGKRGPVLEIDKNEGGYVSENCVLSCYYCNNDKSYTTSKEEYKNYFGPNRKEYFQMLLLKINKRPK